MFAGFRSRWSSGGLMQCRKFIPTAVSWMMRKRSSQGSGSVASRVSREPVSMYSMTRPWGSSQIPYTGRMYRNLAASIFLASCSSSVRSLRCRR
ncbi:hypothetical protein VZT92_005936 [Zoarces viviparus]|uniref:Uncharacterized protein n=1 Tax=Zoarces viviparus TaxID=48416 RepID=A0AAW1FPR5_ZOAVI